MALWPFLFILALFLAFAVNEGWQLIAKRRQLQRLKKQLDANRMKGGGILALAEKILGWYGNKSKLNYRLIRAGNPKYIGQSPAHFYASKLILALVGAFFIGKSGWPMVYYGLGGFMAPDILIWLGIKKRQEQMLHELPEMLDFLRKSLSSGTQMPQALAALAGRLQGPLQGEVIRLSAYYNLTMDISSSLDDFSKRVDMDEVDNMILALKQGEQTGRVKALLTQQSEMLKTRMSYDQKINTQNRANFLPLVSVLMVINIMMLVGLPIVLKIMSESFFQH